MEKKASEILLELEQKIDLMLGYLKTSDLNYKLIIARLDKLASLINQTPSVSLPQTKILENKLIAKPAVVEFQEVDENNSLIINEELQPQVGRRDLRTQGQSIKKIQVQQKITYSDGKVVILANVEIFDSSNNLVKKTRTNSAGKWIANLDPGPYLIKIYKPPTSNKPVVERQYEVQIPISDVPVEL
jgi:hypothetical protein